MVRAGALGVPVGDDGLPLLRAELPGHLRGELHHLDVELVPAIARALAEDPRTAHDFPGVQVASFLGHVVLSGIVASREEWDIADDVVVNVPGVRSVDNRLRIAPEELARPQT